MKRLLECVLLSSSVLAAWPMSAMAASSEDLLKIVKAVGREGKGHIQATKALRELTQADASVLPAILRAFDGAGPLASNWLRGAVETIADRAIKNGDQLPAGELEKFILDTKRNPRARRLAYEWLLKVDNSAENRLIPRMLEDPSPELRRDAVARLIDEAKQLEENKQTELAAAIYRKALKGAVDDDQVKAIVAPLKTLGQEVDLQKHFGFLTRWRVIGPFDNRGKKGFDVAYPPEKENKSSVSYQGQLGQVRWQPLVTDHEYGIVDIVEQIGNYKGAVMYAVTEYGSAKQQTVDIRIGTPNAWKLWVNGKLMFAHEEYHRGNVMDQYRVKANLKPGPNVILVKICQDEQTEDWTEDYQFQLRICSAAGSAILSQAELNTSTKSTRTTTAGVDE